MSVEEIIEQALKLSPQDRAAIAEHLYESVEYVENDPEFKALLERRWDEIVTGKVKTLSMEEVMEKARKRLQKEGATNSLPS